MQQTVCCTFLLEIDNGIFGIFRIAYYCFIITVWLIIVLSKPNIELCIKFHKNERNIEPFLSLITLHLYANIIEFFLIYCANFIVNDEYSNCINSL